MYGKIVLGIQRKDFKYKKKVLKIKGMGRNCLQTKPGNEGRR